MVLELRKLSEDEKIRQQAEARADYDSRIATAKGAGLREGMEKGIEKGIESATSVNIRNIMDSLKYSYDEACDVLKVQDREKYRKLV